VAGRKESLLAQIEHDVLNGAPLADTLRKCVMLGGHAGSAAMTDWANQELTGYDSAESLPDYRRINAPLQIDGTAGNMHYKGQTISALQLPEFARETMAGPTPMMAGVGEIEALVRDSHRKESGVVRLTPGMGSDLVAYMNSISDNPFQHIERLYWAVNVAALEGLLDRIRTSLTGLIAELRMTLPGHDGVPTAAAADQAVAVIVHGKRNRVVVTTDSPHSATSIGSPDVADSPVWWRGAKGMWALVIGAATIAGGIFTYLQWAR
jgi:hypothetical protein